jgi:hypothetical protein
VNVKRKPPEDLPLFPAPPQKPGFQPLRPDFIEKIKGATGAKYVRFDGSDYDPKIDDVRLSGQLLRVFNLMCDRSWRTLDEIADATGDPPASISAQLRHLRKKRFGRHTVDKRSRGDRADGLFEYQLTVNKP